MMDVIDSISIRLNEIFGDRYTIYLEAVEQDLQTPCFFIQPIDSMDSNMIHNRKHRVYSFVIDYIPEDDSGHRTQFTEVHNKLFDSFDSVTLANGVVLPTFERSINITDDILHFIVRFKFYGYTQLPEEDVIETMDISVI